MSGRAVRAQGDDKWGGQELRRRPRCLIVLIAATPVDRGITSHVKNGPRAARSVPLPIAYGLAAAFAVIAVVNFVVALVAHHDLNYLWALTNTAFAVGWVGIARRSAAGP